MRMVRGREKFDSLWGSESEYVILGWSSGSHHLVTLTMGPVSVISLSPL